MSNREVFETALKTWGDEDQTLMVFEEMSELQKELCKHSRGKDNTEQIAEEIADVQIMLEQMIILHDCEEAVKEYRRSKIERLKIRLGIEEDVCTATGGPCCQCKPGPCDSRKPGEGKT